VICLIRKKIINSIRNEVLKLKKNAVLIIAILSIIILLSGCTGVTPTPNPNPTPSTYTIKVISQCGGCWGNVVVNGVPSGGYLIAWGAVNVSGVPAGAAIRLEDEFGWVSHTEFFNPMMGTNVVFNYF